jgi:hypothetical protein
MNSLQLLVALLVGGFVLCGPHGRFVHKLASINAFIHIILL